MPSGKVHDRITIVTAAAALPIWCAASPTRDFAAISLVLGSYLFSGFWLSDDLDTNSLAYRRWGKLRWLWWPYRKCVPHRSWVSHGLGIGPLLRVAYFLFMVWLTAHAVFYGLYYYGYHVNQEVILGGLWSQSLAWTIAHPTDALWITLGLVLGGVTHSVADSFVSFVKRVW